MNRLRWSLRSASAPFITLMVLVLIGCSDSTTPPEDGETNVELITILCNPLAPAPPETATLTAQITGQGGAADVQWSVDGGTLLDNGTIAVRWQVPEARGVCRVTAIAHIGTAVDTVSKNVMVRTVETIPTGIKYSWYPNVIDGELYFVGSSMSPGASSFLGYNAYHQLDSGSLLSTNPNPPVSGGYEFEFTSEALLASVITGGSEYLRQQPTNIIIFPYAPTPKRYVSNNDQQGSTFRKNQHVHADATPDLGIIVWQFNRVGAADDGTQDLINIDYRMGTTPIRQLTTSVDSTFQFGAWVYRYYRNIKPLISPNQDKIVYFVDSTESYEPCVIPLEGGEPDLEGRRAFMVDGRHGIFYYAGVTVSERTVFEWNPVNPNQLAFIDGGRNFCILDLATETVSILAAKVNEFAFSDDGKIAAIGEDGVHIGTSVADAARVFARERSSDDIVGVTWSKGTTNQRVAFRMVRKGTSSIESFSALVLYSVDAGEWYFATSRVPFGSEPSLDDYRWKRAAFDPAGGGVYMPFPLPGTTGATIYYSY